MDFIVQNSPLYLLELIMSPEDGCMNVTCSSFGVCKIHCGSITCGEMSASHMTWD